MSGNWLIWLWLLVPAALAAQERTDPPTLTVDATASVEREPNRAVLTLAVESEAATAQAASQANANAMARVIEALRRAGLAGPAVRTVSVQLMPVYSQAGRTQQEAPRITGYRARNMVQATVDSVARVGSVIDAAVGAGANRVAGISFELKDPESARMAALGMAMEKARREAETAARAAGLALGPAVNINLSSPVYAPPRPMFADRAALQMQAVETPVEAGTLTITATVQVVYRLVSR